MGIYGGIIEMKCYHAEVINLSLKDKKMIKKYPVLKCKNRFLGLCKIYTISISENDIEDVVKAFQKNMSTSLKKRMVYYVSYIRRRNCSFSGKNLCFVEERDYTCIPEMY